MPEFEDDYSINYSNHRQLAEFQNSAFGRIVNRPAEETAQTTESEELDTGSGLAYKESLTEEERLAALEAPDLPLEEPFVDPTTAFIGGGTGATMIKTAKSAINPIVRFAVGGTTAAVADVPIGQAADVIEEKVPGAGLPFSVVTGVLTGTTIEHKIEKVATEFIEGGTIRKLLTSGTKSKRAITEQVDKIKANLKAGDVEADEPTKQAAKELEEAATFKIAQKEESDLAVIEKSFGKDTSPSYSVVPRTEANTYLNNVGEDISDKAININFARINSEDDVKELIKKVADSNKAQFMNAKRGVQSNKQTQKLANLVNMDVDTLLARRSGQAFNAEEALAARQLLVSSGETVARLAATLNGPNPAKFDEVAFRKAITLHKAIQEQVTGATAEAGRALQQFNIKAGSSKAKTKQLNDIIEATAGGQISIKDIAKAVTDMKTPRELNAFIPKAFKARTIDAFMEAWINGLLSGPQTHAVNTLSNSLVAAWQIPERFVAAGISKMWGTGDEGVKFGEALAQTYGLFRGIENGIDSAVKEFQGEPIDIINKLEVNHPRAISAEALELSGTAGRAVDLLGKVVRVPGAALGIEDAFFKSIGYRMELQAQAYRAASAEGLKGDAFSKRVTQIVNNPPENIHLASIDAGRYQTFTNELTGIGKDVQRMSNKYPLMKVVIPFVRTPANIAKFSIARSPFAPILKDVRAEIAAGGAKADVAKARIALGSTVMGMAAMWAAEGKITGGGPTDPNIKSGMYLSGWQPYSIKIGDEYVSYGRLEPLGTLLGVAADFSDISGSLDTKEADEIAVALSASIVKNITSKTFLSGISDAIKVMDDPQRYGDRYLQRLAGSFVPASGAMGQIARYNDPTLREMRNIMDGIIAKIPGYSKTLPARRNIFGEPITLSGGLGPDIISPLYMSKEMNGKLGDEIVNNVVPITMPSDTISGVELTPEQQDELITLTAGPLDLDDPSSPDLRGALNDMIESDDYLNATPGENGGQSDLIRMVINMYKQKGQGLLLDKDETLQTAIEARAEANARKFGF